MDVHKSLADQYRRVAARYGERFGQSPPPLEADPVKLAATIRSMTDAINGRQSPEAGPAVSVSDDVVLTIVRRGAVAEIAADVGVYDAHGNLAGTRRVVIDPSDELATELANDLVTIARRRALG